jgi:hypothetical protein
MSESSGILDDQDQANLSIGLMATALFLLPIRYQIRQFNLKARCARSYLDQYFIFPGLPVFGRANFEWGVDGN